MREGREQTIQCPYCDCDNVILYDIRGRGTAGKYLCSNCGQTFEVQRQDLENEDEDSINKI